jgi:hypothetical protein
MKKVLCNNTDLPRVFAHVLDDGTIDIVRQDQRFTVIGESFTLIGTNPQGGGKTVLQIVNGKLIEDDIKFKEETPEPIEEKETKNGEKPTGNDD